MINRSMPDSQEKEDKSKLTIGLLILFLIAGTSLWIVFSGPNTTDNDIEELDFEGMSVAEATQELSNAGISDITVDHSEVEHDYGVVSDVDISDNEAYIILEEETLDPEEERSERDNDD